MNDNPHFVLNVGSSCDAIVEALAAGRLMISSPTLTRTVDLAPPSPSPAGGPSVGAMILQLDPGASGGGEDAYKLTVIERDENGASVTREHRIKMQSRYASIDLPVVKEAIEYWCAYPQSTRANVVALFFKRLDGGPNNNEAKRKRLHRYLQHFEASR